MFINKVKGLHMEKNIDAQRILLVELKTSINLGTQYFFYFSDSSHL